MTGSFDQILITQVQQANDIVDIVAEHISLAKKGREMVGLCPFHEDHRPSLYVNPAKQIFKCFACSAGGDVFKFIQMRENLTFPQAVERLAHRAGIRIKPAESAGRDRQFAGDEIDPNQLAKINNWAADYFQKNLADQAAGKFARDYLAQRQITPQSTTAWRLGLALDSPDHLTKSAVAAKLPTKLLLHAGLVISQNGALADRFVNRLMFTITDVTGRVIGFGGRTLAGADAKYINSPTTVLFDKSNSMYGLYQARHQIVASETAVVVEGYTDCLMAHQIGCTNVVATLGTSFTSGHARLLRRYAKRAVLVFDSDSAGAAAANRALQTAVAHRLDIKITHVPEEKDPCDFLIAHGKEPFQTLVQNADDVFSFKWQRLTKTLDADNSLADNKAALEEFLDTVAAAACSGNLSALDKGLLVNRLAKITGLDSAHLNSELHKRTERAARVASYPDTGGTRTQKVARPDLGTGLAAAAQREILEVLLNQPQLWQLAKENISAADFDLPILSQIAGALFDTLSANPQPDLKDILAATESVDAGSLIVELADAGRKKANFDSRLTGALDALKRTKKQKTKTNIKAIDDETGFLRRASENAVKKNPHNIGLT
jgi:DNA primase